MKLGANSVLFGGHDMETAFKYIKAAGYDGIEVSAINGMSEHLVLAEWRERARTVKELSARYELPVQAMEQPSRDAETMALAFQAAAEIARQLRLRDLGGLVVIDSPEVGLVAVLPIGMAYVSSVNLTTEVGAELRKGDPFGYFLFGGSDIVMVFQDRNVVLDAEVGRKYLQGQRLGEMK